MCDDFGGMVYILADLCQGWRPGLAVSWVIQKRELETQAPV